jgi:CheY-like chemotaxis protein
MKGESNLILLVEDDQAHAEVVRRNLSGSRIAIRLKHVSDGQSALDYLLRRGEFSSPALSPRPGLILLDLHLPKVDGLEVLKAIKSDAGLSKIPVVMLTTSASESDVTKAYAFHANSYLVKPANFQQFGELIEALGYYWLLWNQHPT